MAVLARSLVAAVCAALSSPAWPSHHQPFPILPDARANGCKASQRIPAKDGARRREPTLTLPELPGGRTVIGWQ